MASESLQRHLVDFDIDHYINPWIPHNRLYVLPRWASRFLGYRPEPPRIVPPLLQWPFMFLATVAGLCLAAGISNYSPSIQAWNPPVIVASLGASAVLDFNAVATPLAQPRNSIIGNTLSAIVGVAITKLFQLHPNFDSISWVAAAIGCACASLIMSMTNTVHPPGGATSVLAATNKQIIAMGWRFVPLVLLGSTLLVLTGLIFNNILRQYPMYWWTPEQVGRQLKKTQNKEGASEDGQMPSKESERTSSIASSECTLRPGTVQESNSLEWTGEIRIDAVSIQIPGQIHLEAYELNMLHRLQQRLVARVGQPPF